MKVRVEMTGKWTDELVIYNEEAISRIYNFIGNNNVFLENMNV